MIKISNRLKQLATYVEKDDKVVDVGCDHALLDVYLATTINNKKIIATDIRESALNQALQNIKKYKLTDIIETRLGDGLDVVDSDEVNTIIISGLGANKIVYILNKNKSKLRNINKIIIQSNSDSAKIRKCLCNLNYHVADEKLVKENNIIYTVMLFRQGKKRYSKRELLLGPILIIKKDKLFNELSIQNIKKNEALLSLIPLKYIIKRYKLKKKNRMLKNEIYNKSR